MKKVIKQVMILDTEISDEILFNELSNKITTKLLKELQLQGRIKMSKSMEINGRYRVTLKINI